MSARRIFLAILAVFAAAHACRADLIASEGLKSLDLQRYWHLRLPLERGECVCRLVLLDDTLYAITSTNRALAVHSRTGVVKWSNVVADEGQTLRGPTHSSRFTYFTTSGSVRAFDRQSGDLAPMIRALRGVVIEVMSETATISIGADHGVQTGDVLNVYRASGAGGHEDKPIAHLRITAVQPRNSRGHLERAVAAESARPGDPVEADVTLPLQEIKLPFAASSAAVGDNHRIYVGAANQRFYSVDMFTGVQHWQLLTPNTVSATPVLYKENLYIAGQDGQVFSITKDERAKNWVFQTEAPIFAELAIDSKHVVVASTDRSLYCLDRASGARLWRERFDTPLSDTPVIAGPNLYQNVPDQGLVVLSADSGRQIWRRPEGGKFLAQFGEDVYLFSGGTLGLIMRVSAVDGRRKELAHGSAIEFSQAGVADQSIFLGNSLGDLSCLRPADAPRLKPEEVETVLRNERKIRVASELETLAKAAATEKAKSKVEAPKPRSLFESDDGLASRSTAKPVGGHGVLKEPTQPAAGEKPAPAKAETKEGAKEGEEGGDAKEPAEGAKAKEAVEEGEEKAAEESGEEKPAAKETKAKSEEKGAKATSKKAEEEGEKEEGGEEEGGEKEGGG